MRPALCIFRSLFLRLSSKACHARLMCLLVFRGQWSGMRLKALVLGNCGTDRKKWIGTTTDAGPRRASRSRNAFHCAHAGKLVRVYAGGKRFSPASFQRSGHRAVWERKACRTADASTISSGTSGLCAELRTGTSGSLPGPGAPPDHSRSAAMAVRTNDDRRHAGRGSQHSIAGSKPFQSRPGMMRFVDFM